MIINWNWYCKTHQAGIAIEIGIAEKPYLVLLLLLILQKHLLSYWYWYCYCKTLLADVDIDVAIAIQLYPISLLVLVLQNHHLNIEWPNNIKKFSIAQPWSLSIIMCTLSAATILQNTFCGRHFDCVHVFIISCCKILTKH